MFFSLAIVHIFWINHHWSMLTAIFWLFLEEKGKVWSKKRKIGISMKNCLYFYGEIVIFTPKIIVSTEKLLFLSKNCDFYAKKWLFSLKDCYFYTKNNHFNAENLYFYGKNNNSYKKSLDSSKKLSFECKLGDLSCQ